MMLFKNKKITAIEIETSRGVNAQHILNNLNIEKIYFVDPYNDYIDNSEREDRCEVKKSFLNKINKIAKKRLRKYSEVN